MTNVKEEVIEKNGITIKKKVAKEAIVVLKKLNENFSESQSKKPLFDDSAENLIYLQVTLKKIPPKKLKRMIKVKLPHSLLTDTSEVCLITGDLDKRDKKAEIEPTIQHYKDLLNKHGVKGIAEVVPLRQLRTEYKTYESKRQLSAAYDMFLNDKKITGVLPKVLGKAFYEKRKFPTQIHLDSTNLKEQVERALSEIAFSISCRGNSCTSEVARISMADNEILENILTCVKSLEDNVPGKWINILGLYIKTAKSNAIPIYMSFDDSNELKIKIPRHQEKVKAEELSTVNNAVVKVFKDGRIVVKNLPLSKDENSAGAADVDVQEVQVKQEAVSNINTKKSKSKRNKAAKIKDNSVCETNDEGEVTNEVGKESEVDIKSSVQKKSNKRKSMSQSINEPVTDLNGMKKRLRSQSNMEVKIESGTVDDANDKLETDIQEETKIHVGSSAQKKTRKRKSKNLLN